MRRLVSCSEASRLDEETRRAAALPAILLMEDASLRLWDALKPIASSLGAGCGTGPMVALCGAGNNAGDALALMRHARFAGLDDLVAILGRDEPGELAAIHLASLRSLGIAALSWSHDREACLSLLAGAALVVDGIAGTGLDGPLRGGLAELVEAANAAGRPIASIDLPSGFYDGFHGGSRISASWTLSIEPRKAALYAPSARSAAGEIVPVEGVFPRRPAMRLDGEAGAFLIEESDIGSWLPPDSPARHKGRRGRLAAFAGSIGSSGAACLASRAALASGAGLVSLFASAELVPILSSRLEAVMVKPEPAEPGAIGAERWDAALAGPGWGRTERNRAALGRLLGSGLPAVLDADAIRLYSALLSSGFEPSGPLILTPHPGEYEALTGVAPETALADPATTLRERAAALRAVIVLKSHVTWIAAPDGRLAVWEGMESGLATAGSGDVLAGLAAGISAACAAVAAHGTAGRRARAERGWFEAGDLVAEAGRILGGAHGRQA
jgi:hydroxyethylthiazole kinase-like uncharacterized protein yjeF